MDQLISDAHIIVVDAGNDPERAGVARWTLSVEWSLLIALLDRKHAVRPGQGRLD